jgi:AraC-like DNA-binding protein
LVVRFLIQYPSADLAPYVDHYWFAEAAGLEAGAGAQFPSGGVALLFNLGPPQALLDAPGGEPTWYDDAWVAGERARPYHLWSPHGARVVGVAFRPGGARPFFDCSLADFTDQVVTLADLWPAGLLEPALEGFASVDASRDEGPVMSIRALERVLLLRLDISRLVGLGLVGAAVRRLAATGPGASVRGVAADLGVSTRYLRRVFKDDVGIGPKTLHRVLRFQRLIARLQPPVNGREGEPDWSAIAVACGYFDQSHLIRDFRQFTDLRPNEYLALRSPDPNFASDSPSRADSSNPP